MKSVTDDLERDGIAVLPEHVDSQQLGTLANLFGDRDVGGRIVDVLPRPVADLLAGSSLRNALASIDPSLRPIRVLLFRKEAGANWFVPWHQDAAVAVEGDALAAGFSNPTIKEGVPHFEAPEALLRKMVSIRVQIDPARDGDGPLEVALGTPRLGLVDAGAAQQAVGRSDVRVCTATAGEVHLLRPLLIHRSCRATVPSGRRTVQIEMAPADWLAAGLRWALKLDGSGLARAA